jgi:hypothetical protein
MGRPETEGVVQVEVRAAAWLQVAEFPNPARPPEHEAGEGEHDEQQRAATGDEFALRIKEEVFVKLVQFVGEVIRGGERADDFAGIGIRRDGNGLSITARATRRAPRCRRRATERASSSARTWTGLLDLRDEGIQPERCAQGLDAIQVCIECVIDGRFKDHHRTREAQQNEDDGCKQACDEVKPEEEFADHDARVLCWNRHSINFLIGLAGFSSDLIFVRCVNGIPTLSSSAKSAAAYHCSGAGIARRRILRETLCRACNHPDAQLSALASIAPSCGHDQQQESADRRGCRRARPLFGGSVLGRDDSFDF